MGDQQGMRTRTWKLDQWDGIMPVKFRAQEIAEEIHGYLVRDGGRRTLAEVLEDFVLGIDHYDDLEAQDFETFLTAVILFLLQWRDVPPEEQEILQFPKKQLPDYPLFFRHEFEGRVRDARALKRREARERHN